jgi:hypothetical protein
MQHNNDPTFYFQYGNDTLPQSLDCDYKGFSLPSSMSSRFIFLQNQFPGLSL